jgi:hypothetical protein
MTVAEVGETLKLNQHKGNWIDAGTLPSVRIGRRRVSSDPPSTVLSRTALADHGRRPRTCRTDRFQSHPAVVAFERSLAYRAAPRYAPLCPPLRSPLILGSRVIATPLLCPASNCTAPHRSRAVRLLADAFAQRRLQWRSWCVKTGARGKGATCVPLGHRLDAAHLLLEGLSD